MPRSVPQHLQIKSWEDFRELARASMRKLTRDGTLIEAEMIFKAGGFTKQALAKAQSEGRVFSVDVDAGRYFPAFFVDSRYDRAKIEEVSRALGELPGSSKLQFFLNGRWSLGGKTPLEALMAGQDDKVLAAAKAFVQG